MRLGGRLLSILLPFFGFILSAALAAPATASDTPIVPSAGGIKIIAQCDPGQAVVGYGYNASEWLTAIVPLCEKVTDGKVVPPVLKAKGLKGAKSGAGFDPMVCPDGTAVTGIALIFFPMKATIRSFYALCSKIEGGKAIGKAVGIDESHFIPHAVDPGPNGLSDPLSQVASIGAVTCPEGQFATGFLGGNAKEAGFLGLGLRCSVGAKPAPPPDDDQATTDTGDDDTMKPDTGDDDTTTDDGDNGDNGITVDDGDNGFKITIQIGPNTLKFGPQGKVRVAKEPTTVYAKPAGKEIAYLDKGAKVTVLACEDKGMGWCQIVKPKAGFVWGGDLK